MTPVEKFSTMAGSRVGPVLILVLALPFGFRWATAQEAAGTAEDVVHELYQIVTFPAGTLPDWNHLRSLFLPEAVVVLRTSHEANTVFTLEEFVQDWLSFIERDNVEDNGGWMIRP